MSQRSKRIRLVVCRHTESNDNASGRFSGHDNPPLNERGIAQAYALGKEIAQLFGFVGIVSSDLLRARMVAEEIARWIGFQPWYTSELREVNLGSMNGMLKTDATKHYPEPRYRTQNPDFDFRGVGGECAGQVVERQELFLNRILQRYGMHARRDRHLPRIVLVGHGTSLRRLFVEQYGLLSRLHEQGSYQEVVWPPTGRS